MKEFNVKTYFIFLLVFILILASTFFIWQGIYIPKDPVSKDKKIFIIEKGEGTKEIAHQLEKESFIKSAPLFRAYSHFKRIAGKLQAGEYELSPAMNVPEILEKFILGDVIKVTITFPEGLNLIQVSEKLMEHFPEGSQIKNFRIKGFSQDFEFFQDAPQEASLEGFLFPDTYQFSLRASQEEIGKKMLANFDKKLTEDVRTEILGQEKTIFEIITMASLLEKEVKAFEDKKLVSGILWKRLENKMPLQVDATITYITGKKSSKVSLDETKIDSPYNTYKYKGLPPGPISNPGLESIVAAIYPKKLDYLYYLSTPEGETIFSKTFEEHKRAKEQYFK